MDSGKPPAIPAPSPSSAAPQRAEQPPPDNLVEHLRGIGRAASAVGERLKNPENLTLGEILRLFGLTQ